MAVILIVDDDPALRAIATEMLRDEQHAIIEAGDGDEALAILRTVPVDLVVLDMLMPNRDGLETIRDIRSTRSAVRILAISGGGRLDRSQLLRTAFLFGADDTLCKPLRLETFAAKISEILAREECSSGPFGGPGESPASDDGPTLTSFARSA